MKSIETHARAFLTLNILAIGRVRTIVIQIGKKYWDLETCRKSLKSHFEARLLPIGMLDKLEAHPLFTMQYEMIY